MVLSIVAIGGTVSAGSSTELALCLSAARAKAHGARVSVA